MTRPLKVAFTGPTAALTVAWSSVSLSFCSSWQPGMQRLSTSGSLSAVHTVMRSAGSATSPDIVIAMAVLPARRSPSRRVRT